MLVATLGVRVVLFAFVSSVCYQRATVSGALAEKVPTRRKVVIIGAGMAGIQAAYTLHTSAIQDFSILEANSSIGGRVAAKMLMGGHPMNTGPLTINRGAKFVHGVPGSTTLDTTEINPIWMLADNASLLRKNIDFYNRLFYIDNGTNGVNVIVKSGKDPFVLERENALKEAVENISASQPPYTGKQLTNLDKIRSAFTN
ncbi:uncharacterized protein LOC134197929 [Corticium candelabrum]|uniref:uncharacterized protein LOC134197929 n=1 Tax=Corticium candelabrum TaxID=121492 RepID=UPI002E25E66B|nr:uncharacterized protein LOC134197929 [Corticium candelabrum]